MDDPGRLMPTTVDRYLASHQLLQQIADMQNNMRETAQIIQAAFRNPDSALFNNLPLVQQKVRDAGAAYLQRITTLTTFVADHLAAAQAGTAALGITWTDVTGTRDLLFTWATNLNTATITTATQLDNSVAALLAAVPAGIQPYFSRMPV